MTDIMTADKVKTLMQPLLDKGCFFEYFYEKGGDSSCVYIYRFQKGKNFFDLREVSGGNELNFVVFANGEYQFPSLKYLYKNEFRSFKLRHLFRAPTRREKREFFAKILTERAKSGEFFSLPL